LIPGVSFLFLCRPDCAARWDPKSIMDHRSFKVMITAYRGQHWKGKQNIIQRKKIVAKGKGVKLVIIGLYHPLDGVTNPKYKLLYSFTTNFFRKEKKALPFNGDRCCHLALCLRLILFHHKISKAFSYLINDKLYMLV
jgi:hypothetical protein